MASKFIIHMSAELVQPNKQALLSLTNFLWHNDTMKHGYMKYNIVEGRTHVQSYVMDGRDINLEILNDVLLRGDVSTHAVHRVLEQKQNTLQSGQHKPQSGQHKPQSG